MSLVTVDDFRGSLEARQAGVHKAGESDITAALRDAEAELYRTIGYRVEGPTPEAPATTTTIETRGSGGPVLALPARVKSLASATQQFGYGTIPIAALNFRPILDGLAIESIYHFFADDVPVTLVGTFGYDENDDVWRIAAKAVRLMACNELRPFASDTDLPQPFGAHLTGYQTEGAAFSFAPADDTRIKELVDQIMHPYKRDNVVSSVRLAGSGHRAGFSTDQFPNQSSEVGWR